MSKAYIPKALRARVTAQARQRCGYCLTRADVVGTPMEIEHLLPEALGGLTVEANLWVACSLCNTHKSDRVAALDPESGEIVTLFHPRAQAWQDHFAWTEDGERIVGVTPIGRATVVALQLNRPALLRARALWVSVGWHPPRDE